MDPSPENAQDSPQTTDRSDVIALARKFNTYAAQLIMVGLRYLDCDIESIFSVLESYDQGGTVLDVARYIEAQNILPYHEIFPRGVAVGDPQKEPSLLDRTPNHQRTYNTGTRDTTFVVDYARELPVKFVAKSRYIRTLFPREIVSVGTSDGQKIITIVVDGQVRCCSWDEVDFSIHMG